MQAAGYIILFSIFCLTPALVLRLCRRFPALGKIGPVVILYLAGALLGNLGFFGIDFFPSQLPEVQNILNSALVPLAIPMMLFGSVFRKSDTRTQLLAMLTGILAVVLAVTGGYLIFGQGISSAADPELGAKIGAMLSGTYTGGTVNMTSIQKMLGVPEEVFVLANTFDMIVCFVYLMFLVTGGISLFRKMLPASRNSFSDKDMAFLEKEMEKNGKSPYAGMLSRKGIASAGASLGCTILIFGLSYLTATFLDGLAEENIFMMIFILMLTTLGIGCSFIRAIRKLKYSYDMGMYFIYIFSMVVASMADLSKIDFAGSMSIMGMIAFTVFASLILHSIFAKIFRIDADTMIITSVTYVNSPPFVPMIAAAMRNRNVLVTGLTAGIIGYAIGNYLGLLIYRLLLIL